MSVNFLNQYPNNVNFNGYTYPQEASQVAAYAVAATNSANSESKVTDGLGLIAGLSAFCELNKFNKVANANDVKALDALKAGFETSKQNVEQLKKATDNFKNIKGNAAAKSIFDANKVGQEIYNLQSTLPSAKTLKKVDAAKKATYEQAKVVLKKAANAKTVSEKEALLKSAKKLLGVSTKETAKAGSKAAKFVKGNALMLAISGGIELLTNVIPAYKELGATKGTKQLAKSTVKVAGDVAGFAAGTKVGAAVGTCIGGPVGTIVGGVLGAVLGVVGSTLVSKALNKVVGKNEIEIAQENKQDVISIAPQKQTQTNMNFVTPVYTTTPISANDNLLTLSLRNGLNVQA